MGKRKGKPKAKTKAEGGDRHSDLDAAQAYNSTNCDDDLDAGSERQQREDERLDQTVSNCRKLAQTFVSQRDGGQAVETKLVKAAAGGDDADAFRRELRERLERVSRAQSSNNNGGGGGGGNKGPPLISISIAPPTAHGSRSTSCASSTHSTWSLRSTKRQRRADDIDANEAEDELEPLAGAPGAGGQPTSGQQGSEAARCYEPARRDSCASSGCDVFENDDSETCPINHLSNADNNQPLEPTTISGLELVRKSYIRLIKHNSLQNFYLGSLIYSVMIITYLLVSTLLVDEDLQPLSGSLSPNRTNDYAVDDNPFGNNNNNNNNNDLTSVNCDNYDLLSAALARSVSLRQEQGMRVAKWIGLSVMLPATLGLMLVIALEFYIEFSYTRLKRHQRRQRAQQQMPRAGAQTNKPAESSQRPDKQEDSPRPASGRKFSDILFQNVSPHSLRVLAIFLSLWLLTFPISFYLYQQQSLLGMRHSAMGRLLPCKDSKGSTEQRDTSTHLPIVMLGLIIYIVPALISEITSVKWLEIAAAIAILPLVIVVLSVREDSISSINLVVLTLAFVAGRLKHKFLLDLIQRVTFKGASELIEAKVSLEQQRQQQETLLLSVLPAYVAEQVKRTMVKKMESFRGEDELTTMMTGNQDNQQQQPPPPPQGASIHLASTTNIATQTVHGPAHCVRSLTLPAAPDTQLAPAAAAAHQPQASPNAAKTLLVTTANTVQNQRSSFARASRLSSSLASGAAYISEALLSSSNRTHLKNHEGAVGNLCKTSASAQTQLSALGGAIQQSSSIQNYGAWQAQPGSLQQQSRRGFNELYIRTYNNVSLLYGDIVGFTQLCTQLSSSQLVRVLNNLFSHFDHLAEQHKIMRIKILGDCYYGVAGIPEFAVMGAKKKVASASAHRFQQQQQQHNQQVAMDGHGRRSAAKSAPAAGRGVPTRGPRTSDNHAISCVNMGLDMIQYMKRVNISRATSTSVGSLIRDHQTIESAGPPEASQQQQQQQLPANFELNMRIGIHTGHIHSGVIGLKKWQFDVWSNDVSIAMHCESSGVAGRVQVTEATVQHLRGAFTLEPATRSPRDTFLADQEIRTYLIKDRASTATQRAHGASMIETAPTSARQLPTPSSRASSITCSSSLVSTNSSANCASFGALTAHHASGDLKEGAAMDEERIREATIGIVRQTLLSPRGDAGEDDYAAELGASGATCRLAHGEVMSGPLSGACGLASQLDHNDIRWLSLTFKDPALNRSFSERSGVCSTTRYLLELLILFVLLALALHLVDYLMLQQVSDVHLDQSYYSNAILLGGSLVASGLLLAALPKPSFLLAGTRLMDHKRSPSSVIRQVPGSHQRRNSHLSSVSWFLGVNAAEADPEDRPLSPNVPGRSVASRVIKLLAGLPLVRRHRCLRKNPNESTIDWLTSSLLVFAILVAIVSQIHLVGGLMCPLASGGTFEHAREVQQITVLVLLMTLDLSPSLLSYQLRSYILVGIISLESLMLLLATGVLSGAGGRESQHASSLRAAISEKILPLFCAHVISTTGGGGDRVEQPHNLWSIPVASIINWSSDALLLVASLWSLAYQRQVESVRKCNFLWRNRLNVDHEELEYISGINKVLLENILPSHVVQHYLAQPSSVSTHGSNNKLNNEPDRQQARVPTKAPKKTGASESSKRCEDQGKSVSVSSARGHGLVRMSVGAHMRTSSVGGAHGSPGELYHEQHESVAVMFASIPHFYEFYDESDISKQGLGCIALLNEIICDFDKLLLKNKFSRIEKIKTIGSSYMAAAGLRPSGALPGALAASQVTAASPLSSCPLSARNSTASQAGQAAPPLGDSCATRQQQVDLGGRKSLALSQQKMNLICMIQFATSLMSALNGINKQSFQVFKLRVGVNTGPVIAGIIGAQRPFYDIWGDCVNIASRMESLGEVGRIQVEERTAKLLMECPCNENYSIKRRGPIDVKGKGGMVTYFVDRKEQDTQQQQAQESHASSPSRRAEQTDCPSKQVAASEPAHDAAADATGATSQAWRETRQREQQVDVVVPTEINDGVGSRP